MKRIGTTTAIVLLAVLIQLRSYGQQTPAIPPAQEQEQEKEKELPPIRAQCQAAEKEFVKGQNLEIKCDFLLRRDVKLDSEDLTKINDNNFTTVEFSVSEIVSIPNQKDYGIVTVTQTLKPHPELKYGKYFVKPSAGYSYPETKWLERDGRKTLETKIVHKKVNLPAVVFEKVPLLARIDGGEGFQDVVNIGEHIQYTLHIFYEKGAVVFLNDLTPVELDRKYGLRDATRFDNPDLKPFVVINRDDPAKKTEINRRYHAELVYEYRLALYEVSLVKMFEIPSVSVYYTARGDEQVRKLATSPIKIRTNSVLNQDSDFRPLKNIQKSDPDKLRRYGWLPLRVAYAAAALAGLIILYGLLLLLARCVRKIYRTGLLAALTEMKRSATAHINELVFVARFRAQKALIGLIAKPNQDNLQTFIVKLRLYLGVVANIKPNLALSLTVSEFNRKLNVLPAKQSMLSAELGHENLKNANALENAEYLLDEQIGPEDLNVLKQNFAELIRKYEEVGTWS